MTRQLNLDELDGHFGDDEPEEDTLDDSVEDLEFYGDDEDLDDEVDFDFDDEGFD